MADTDKQAAAEAAFPRGQLIRFSGALYASRSSYFHHMFYTEPPGGEGVKIRSSEVSIDLRMPYEIKEALYKHVHGTDWVSVRIEAQGKSLWTNVSKNGRQWCECIPPTL